MIPWTRRDVAYTYPWSEALTVADQDQFTEEINEYLADGTTLDPEFDSLVEDWRLTARVWHQHPEEMGNLVDVIESHPDNHPLRRRETYGPALRQLYMAVPFFGGLMLPLWLTPHPGVGQTLAWIGLYIYIVTSWMLWGSVIRETNKQYRKRRSQD